MSAILSKTIFPNFCACVIQQTSAIPVESSRTDNSFGAWWVSAAFAGSNHLSYARLEWKPSHLPSITEHSAWSCMAAVV